MKLSTTTAAGCTRLAPARAPCLRTPYPLARQSRAVRAEAVMMEVERSAAELSPEDLIELTKEFAQAPDIRDQLDMLDKDYVFRSPANGPFNKQDYIRNLGRVTVEDAFPDLKFQTWGFSVDPNNPLRVWYFAQISGTMQNDWDVNGLYFPATNKAIESAPEAHSLEWTPDGKVRYQSLGYCVDRIYSNSPDGSMTVAVFAAFKAAEKPWVLSVLLNPVFETFMALIGGPQATPWENLPEWYRKLPASKLKGSQGLSRV